jgi:hypothetical protein
MLIFRDMTAAANLGSDVLVLPHPLMTWHCVDCATDTTSGATLNSLFTVITGRSRNTVSISRDMIMHEFISDWRAFTSRPRFVTKANANHLGRVLVRFLEVHQHSSTTT